MSSGDPVPGVLAATLVMALIGPICARNYAAPRFAFLLVLLCDLPFGAMQIITSFHRRMLLTLAAEARNRYLAHHDSLTGILNRQGMDEALSRIVPEPDRHRSRWVQAGE
jgi:predicted signal transduction protein with EAL and GGDEF domain